MNTTMKYKQYLAFALLLGASALLAILCYHGLRQDMILFRKGEQLRVRQDFGSAIPLFVKSFKLGNSSPQLLKSLGDAYSGAGMPLSIDVYRLFLTKYPQDHTVRIRLARELARHGRYDEAVLEYRNLLGEKR